MPTVIFLCVANSARSQMAEGLARSLAPPGWRIFSAGSNPGKVSSRAVRVMAEIGIDLGPHVSKGIDDVPIAEADLIVTLCKEEVCPFVPGPVRRLHWPLADPAAVTGTAEQQLEAFRATREEIRRRLVEFWTHRDAGPDR